MQNVDKKPLCPSNMVSEGGWNEAATVELMPRIDRCRATVPEDGLDCSASNGAVTAPRGLGVPHEDRRRYICDTSSTTAHLYKVDRYRSRRLRPEMVRHTVVHCTGRIANVNVPKSSIDDAKEKGKPGSEKVLAQNTAER
jgi:hypothetical protein